MQHTGLSVIIAVAVSNSAIVCAINVVIARAHFHTNSAACVIVSVRIHTASNCAKMSYVISERIPRTRARAEGGTAVVVRIAPPVRAIDRVGPAHAVVFI